MSRRFPIWIQRLEQKIAIAFSFSSPCLTFQSLDEELEAGRRLDAKMKEWTKKKKFCDCSQCFVRSNLIKQIMKMFEKE